MDEILILDRRVSLRQRPKSELKGVTIGDTLSYQFYDGTYHDIPLLFIEPKATAPSPKICALTAARISEAVGLPVVYILPPTLSYERQRLVDKGVYFVVSSKFAFLPMLVANERIRKTKKAKRMSVVAQYILLYHLQVKSLESLSVRELAKGLPFSYESVSLGITCLSDLGLCEKISQGTKKLVHFTSEGRKLWDNAQPFVIDVVEKRIFCDGINSDMAYPVCGINALSHYSMLNPDPVQMLALNTKQLKDLESANSLLNPNEYDGAIAIEVWKYPPVYALGEDTGFVDKLSLAVSLREDKDPRVEGEVERMINEIKWQD